MIEPLRLSLDVGCPVEHAFARLDRPDQPLVAGRPHGERRSDAEVVLEPRSGRADLRADARRARARLGRGDGLGAAAPAGLPVASAPRPGRRHRGRDPLRRGRGTRTRIEIEHTGWERLGAPRPQPGGTATEWAGPPCSRTSTAAVRMTHRRNEETTMPAGTKDDPWQLSTAPGHVGVHDVGRRGRRPADAGLPGRVDPAAATSCAASTTCTCGWSSRATGSTWRGR